MGKHSQGRGAEGGSRTLEFKILDFRLKIESEIADWGIEGLRILNS